MKKTKEVVKKHPKISNGVNLISKSRFNLPHIICNHIIGKEHSVHHRIAVGTVFMLTGVLMSKVTIAGFLVVHYFFEVVGSSFHGIGLMPWIEYITAKVEERNEKFERNLLDLKELNEVEEIDADLKQEIESLEDNKQNDNGNTGKTLDAI